MCNYSSVIRNEGRQEGYTQGRDEWYTKGRYEGRQEGYTEGRDEEREENARRMIRDNYLSDEKIAEYTGLPVSRIQELRNEMLLPQ